MYSQNTLFQAQRMVRSFLRWLYETERTLFNLSEGWLLPRPPDPPRRIPTVAQISALLMVPDSSTMVGLRNRAILELLYGTGIRGAECHALDLDQVDLESSRLHVVGKGSRDRVLPIGGNLRLALERYLEVRSRLGGPGCEEAFFISARGRRLSYMTIGVVVRECAKAVGIEGLTPHGIRHCFAVHLLENGADLAYIQALLGHESLQSTKIYMTISQQELKRAHQRTHPRAQRRKQEEK